MRGLTRLSKKQYLYFASAMKTLSGGVILGASAAFFLPEALQLKESIFVGRYLLILLAGLIFLVFGAILEKMGTK